MAAKQVTKPGTAMTVWEKKMAEAAEKQGKQEKPMSGFLQISTQGGVLSVDGDDVRDNKMNLVIVQSAYENAYYDGTFDAANPKPPICYAFGDLDAEDPEEDMAPHADAPEPQAKTCGECEFNVMGSAKSPSKGKACKNIRRLGVTTEDAISSPENMGEAERRLVKIPVTSVKNWAGYVRNTLTDDLNRPYWSVVTELSLNRDKKTQFKMNFQFMENINFTDKLFAAFELVQKKVRSIIIAPYPVAEEDVQEKAPAKGAKYAGKATVKPAAKRTR